MKKILLLITAALTFAACGKEIVDLTKELQKDIKTYKQQYILSTETDATTVGINFVYGY